MFSQALLRKDRKIVKNHVGNGWKIQYLPSEVSRAGESPSLQQLSFCVLEIEDTPQFRVQINGRTPKVLGFSYRHVSLRAQSLSFQPVSVKGQLALPFFRGELPLLQDAFELRLHWQEYARLHWLLLQHADLSRVELGSVPFRFTFDHRWYKATMEPVTKKMVDDKIVPGSVALEPGMFLVSAVHKAFARIKPGKETVDTYSYVSHKKRPIERRYIMRLFRAFETMHPALKLLFEKVPEKLSVYWSDSDGTWNRGGSML